MRTSSRTHGRLFRTAALAALIALATGCYKNRTEMVDGPQVALSGPVAVEVGAAIELTAATLNGSDSGYGWASSNEAVAQVSAAGRVTGVSPGEVTITATGVDSGAAGAWGVHVWQAEDGSRVTISGPAGVMVGRTIALVAITEGGADTGYSWGSSAPAVATVDQSGVVTGMAPGEATITATGATTGGSDSWGIHVYPSADGAAAVVVTGPSSVEVGGTVTLAAATFNGTDNGYSWESSDAGIATVDATGSVTGVAGGEARISATGRDTGAVGVWGVHVYRGTVPVVVISGPVAMTVGGTASLTAITENGTDTGYVWESSDEGIATIDASGTVSGRADGPVVLTATGNDSGATGRWGMFVSGGSLPVTVVAIIGGVAVEAGHTMALSVVTINGTDSDYTWESSDEGVAVVDRNGSVTGIADGQAVISATGIDTGASDRHGVVVYTSHPEVPFEDQWAGSGHANGEAEAWIHWNGDTDGRVDTSCAKCHSNNGLRDFLGADGTAAGTIEGAALPAVLACNGCHNEATVVLDSVTFPSGLSASGLGRSAICMQCHQGRQSTTGVDTHIAAYLAANPGAGDDTPNPAEAATKLSFQNVHYSAAGATLFGGSAKGGYEYPGLAYDGRFGHAAGWENCTDCHNSHTLLLDRSGCAGCHPGGPTADPHIFRMAGSGRDYDGDGITTEGIRGEIDGLHTTLYGRIQAYATERAGSPIVYQPDSHPYFFIDGNGNGTWDEGETTRYAAWTPRLLRAAYNYQYAAKDTGGYAHNAKYIIQLLYDSIADLNGALSAPIDTSGLTRTDAGHFDGLSESFRHWDGDSDGMVDAACSRCHSAGGFAFYRMYGATRTETPSDGLGCASCHTGADLTGAAPRIHVSQVVFPGGATIANDPGNPDDSFLCLSCHQGRESKRSVDAAITAGSPAFKNVHYAPAGATLYGHAALVGYEYDGLTYAGRWTHAGTVGGRNTAACTYCHDPGEDGHTFEPRLHAGCTLCHAGVTDLAGLRINRPNDYNGNGSTTEPLEDEITGLAARLLARIESVAAGNGTPLEYRGSQYPYWFTAGTQNGFTGWTAGLAKAAFNYQFASKESGAWAHNTNYIGQLLYDSLADLGGDLTGLTRP